MLEKILFNIGPVKKLNQRNIELEEENQRILLNSEVITKKLDNTKRELSIKEECIKKYDDRQALLVDSLKKIKLVNDGLKLDKSNLETQVSYLEQSLSLLENRNESINSSEFWEDNYKNGGTSGAGSYGDIAKFKATVINDIIKEKGIDTAIELGCGDGNQLTYIKYPDYTGVDVSTTIITRLKVDFSLDKTKKFYTTDERDSYINQKFDLSLSLDVIFHLLEDSVYEKYMQDLFSLSSKYVIIYSSNHEAYTPWPEYRHRNFMRFIQENLSNMWKLERFIPNKYPYLLGHEISTSASDFYIFKNAEI